MTLLDSITRAAAAADAGTLTPISKFPIILNSDAILSNLKPPSSPTPNSILHPLDGWTISDTDAAVSDLTSELSEALKRGLKNPSSFTSDDFISILKSFLTTASDKSLLPIPAETSHPDFTSVAIKTLGFLIRPELAGLIAEACLNLDLWRELETLIRQGLVGNLSSTSLIGRLVEKCRPELLCVCLDRVSDLRSGDVLSILRCFLSPSRDCYSSMVDVKKRWEKQAVLAIEMATKRGGSKKEKRLAREAAVLLMMAHDEFSAKETCLHYVFGSSNLDGMVLASAISKLDGAEVLALVRYFLKWLEKYEKFPEAGPCGEASTVLGLWECESLPSLEAVVSGLGLVLDEHFSYLVLNPDFRDEIEAAEKIVASLAYEAGACCRVDGVIRHLKSRAKDNEGDDTVSSRRAPSHRQNDFESLKDYIDNRFVSLEGAIARRFDESKAQMDQMTALLQRLTTNPPGGST